MADNVKWEDIWDEWFKEPNESTDATKPEEDYSVDELFGIAQGTPAEQVEDPKVALMNNDKTSMLNHNTQYDNLLEGYVKNANNMFVIKMVCKVVMFALSLFLLIVVFAIATIIPILSVLGYLGSDNIVSAASLLATFLSTFIVIPKIMSRYLFNENEEVNMAKIIENIQTHDKTIRDGINHENKGNK